MQVSLSKFPSSVRRSHMPGHPAHSPIYKLPLDVIHYLFRVARYSLTPYEAAAFAFRVSSVCSTWRRVALASSELWSTISLCGPNGIYSSDFYEPDDASFPICDFFEPYEVTFPRIECFLTRSRTHPLSVYVDLHDFAATGLLPRFLELILDSICDALIVVLRPHADRFKHFTVCANAYIAIHSFLGHFEQVAMPRLQTMEVIRVEDPSFCLDEDFEPEWLRGHFPLFRSALPIFPKLKNVTLGGASLNWAFFSLANVHTLNISNLATKARPSIEDLSKILSANAHSLHTLEIHGALPSVLNVTMPLQDFPPPIPMPALYELSIGYTRTEEACVFMLTLDMPNLRALSLSDLEHSLRERYDNPHEPRTTEYLEKDATLLCETILTRGILPLDKLETLKLQSVLFASDGAVLPRLDPPHGPELCHSMPRRFFEAMRSLRTLTLEDPDHATLIAINTPIINPAVDNSITTHHSLMLPNPLLTHVRLLNTPIGQIVLFFNLRTALATHKTFMTRRLQEMQVDGGDLVRNRLLTRGAKAAGLDVYAVTEHLEIRPIELWVGSATYEYPEGAIAHVKVPRIEELIAGSRARAD